MAETTPNENSPESHKRKRYGNVYTRKNTKKPKISASLGTLAAEKENSLPQLGSAKDAEPIVTQVEDRVKIKLGSSRSKDEIREVKGKMARELDRIRALAKKVEDKEAEIVAQDAQVTPVSPILPASPFDHVIERRGFGISNSGLHVDDSESDRRVFTLANSELREGNDESDRMDLVIANPELRADNDAFGSRDLVRANPELRADNDAFGSRYLVRENSELLVDNRAREDLELHGDNNMSDMRGFEGENSELRTDYNVSDMRGLVGADLELDADNNVSDRRALVRANSGLHLDTSMSDKRRALGRAHGELRADNNFSDRRALVRANSEMGSVGPQHMSPFRNLSVSVMDNNYGQSGYLEKEKRTPKANQFYRNSEFLLGKDRLPPETNRKHKSNGGRSSGAGSSKCRNQAFRSCNSLLQRLMKHKHGWVFNEPVNANALGLHDYHDVIRNPMDLGTVKTRLAENFYKSPTEFAEDVRRTFDNAMVYNPTGQDVHLMAETLLNIFEERWAVIEAEYLRDLRFGMLRDGGLPTPTSKRAHQPSLSLPQRTLETPYFMPPSRTPVPKKPKAKDLNKRDMTFDEKQKLSTNLQNLPPERLEQLLQIIKRRNLAVNQGEGEEIEVDIDVMDTETLWELDRFVLNYKKSLSKNKRKAEIALQARAGGDDGHAGPVMNKGPPATSKAPKGGNGAVGEIVSASSPGQGEKQGESASPSSSTSSSSDSGSSSSDSDSDSSAD